MKETIKKTIKANPHLYRMIKPIYSWVKKVFKKLRGKPESKDEAIVSGEESVAQIYVSDKKVIYFDITSYSVTDVKTGIQRVVAKFLEFLGGVAGEDYEIICISGLNNYHIIEKDTFRPRDNLQIAPKKGDIYLSIDLNPVQPYDYWDTLKSWQRNGCKLIACVHDLVFIKFPEYVADEDAVYLLSRWLFHAASNYDGLICDSQTVEHELLQWIEKSDIHNEKLKTGFFHHGGDFIEKSTLKPDSTDAFFSCLCGEKPLIFISVATIEPRKGYPDLVSAFEQAAKIGANVMLVIVGRIGWKYEDIMGRIINSECYNKSIFWFSDCEDNLLEILFRLSDCYISGSYYEGFGLGIIEAAKKGLPVLLRDIPVNREVSEEKGLYYKDTDDLKTVLVRISKNPEILRQQAKINSLSWIESISTAWTVIQKMI